MVCPILISVEVTPRISAAEVADHASTTSALAAPNPVTKCIAALPCFILYSARSIGGRARRGWPRSGCGETCHGGLIDAKHNQESGALAFTSPRNARRGEEASVADAKIRRRHKKTRRLRRVFD